MQSNWIINHTFENIMPFYVLKSNYDITIVFVKLSVHINLAKFIRCCYLYPSKNVWFAKLGNRFLQNVRIVFKKKYFMSTKPTFFKPSTQDCVYGGHEINK